LSESALHYFLTYIISRGKVPVNHVNQISIEYEYGPVTRYGVRPQEIIDGIMEDWRSRNGEMFDHFELFFGWEHHCGAFIEDDEEEPET
jgi:hypothetical protein